VDPGYRPRVAIIVPTYDEAQLIEGKFDNVYEQDYPKDRPEEATGIGVDIQSMKSAPSDFIYSQRGQ